MPVGLAYWIVMFLWFLFGFVWPFWRAGAAAADLTVASNALVFILLLMIGWKLFGPPFHP
jgi:hypothetical protein